MSARREPFLLGILAYSSAVLTLAGVVVFFVLHTADSIYYAHYGVSPEEVGLTFENTLAHEVSAMNALLLLVFSAVVVKGTWLLASAGTTEREISEAADQNEAAQQHHLDALAAGVPGDPASAKRQVTRLEAEHRALQERLVAAKRDSKQTRQAGARWLIAAALVFSVWAAVIVTEAVFTPIGPRAPRWFDPLQVQATSVRGLGDPRSAGLALIDDAGMRWLFLGQSGGELVLYSQRTNDLALVPADSVTLLGGPGIPAHG